MNEDKVVPYWWAVMVHYFEPHEMSFLHIVAREWDATEASVAAEKLLEQKEIL